MIMFKRKRIKKGESRIKGFTLIELLVTIFVVVIVSSLVLANFGAFSSRASLGNLAFEVALSIREAQVYGISVREFTPDVFPSYGVVFNTSSDDEFILYADLNDNGAHNGPGEDLEVFTFRGGTVIDSICGSSTSGGDCNNINSLNIIFTRPNPEANIRGIPACVLACAYVKITLKSPRGETRDVWVWSSGQISVP